MFYTRWGRTECEHPAFTIYTGLVAGSHHRNTGGSANLLCLHRDPDVSARIQTPFRENSSPVHGAEYFIGTNLPDNSPFSYRNNYGRNIDRHNAPCALCYRSDREAVTMIPGKFQCPGDLTTEYSGFLTGAQHNHQKSEFNCFDEAPEVTIGSQGADGAHLINIAQVWCEKGAGFCPPFSTYNKVPCSICTM